MEGEQAWDSDQPEQEIPASISVNLVWTSAEDRPFVYTNQAVCQYSEGMFLLTLGTVQPPILMRTTDEERLEQAKDIRYLPIEVQGRFALGRKNVEDLIRVLRENLQHLETRETGS